MYIINADTTAVSLGACILSMQTQRPFPLVHDRSHLHVEVARLLLLVALTQIGRRRAEWGADRLQRMCV